MGLELKRYGFSGEERVVVGLPLVSTAGLRLAHAWDENLEEWFVSDAHGLERGFTVKQRPTEGSSLGVQAATLNFQLAVRGGVRNPITPTGR